MYYILLIIKKMTLLSYNQDNLWLLIILIPIQCIQNDRCLSYMYNTHI